MSKKKVTKTVTTTITEEIVENQSNKTHIVCILDRSGSMGLVAQDAIGGFNRFLKDQKETEGEATMSVTLFDDEYTPLYDGKAIPLKEVPELDEKTFIPRGATALYDAIGRTIARTKEDFDKMTPSEKPDKVLVVIVTDGKENSSKEYNQNQIKDLITDLKKKNWQFIFLCSTEDALTRANSIGIGYGNAFKFTNTSAGNNVLYTSVINNATKLYRSLTTNNSEYDVISNNIISYAISNVSHVDHINTNSESNESTTNTYSTPQKV